MAEDKMTKRAKKKADKAEKKRQKAGADLQHAPERTANQEKLPDRLYHPAERGHHPQR